MSLDIKEGPIVGGTQGEIFISSCETPKTVTRDSYYATLNCYLATKTWIFRLTIISLFFSLCLIVISPLSPVFISSSLRAETEVTTITSPLSRGEPLFYRVKKGDTLYSISRRFGISIDEIKALNNLKGTGIKAGQKILLKRSKEVSFSNTSGPSSQDGLTVTSPLSRDRIVDLALSFLDIPYRKGGLSYGGLDCSGLVFTVFKTLGIVLPRTAREQFTAGEPVSPEEILPGDLVFFFIRNRVFPDHVGIYLGGNLFIHASRSLKRVTISSLESPYFSKRVAGIRRLLPAGTVTSPLSTVTSPLSGVGEKNKDSSEGGT